MKRIVANFKMYKTSQETKTYLNHLSKALKEDEKVTLCLPYTSLHLAKKVNNPNIVIGAQNIYCEERGKFTGEISPEMIIDLGVNTTIIGHSERRKNFYEDDELINKKVKLALANGLTVILCIGETRGQKNSGKTAEVLSKQLSAALSGIYENELKSVIVAYEPVWAIGSGTPATVQQIEKCNAIIREIIASAFSEKASKQIEILYGGSLDSNNAKKILQAKGTDGALVGGAALDPDELLKILRS